MIKLKISLVLCILASSLFAQESPIVDVEWLKGQLDDPNLIILHVSEEGDYKEAHIPGSRFVDSDAYILNGGGRVYDLPELKKLKKLFEEKGLTLNSQIVVYPGKISHLPVTRLLFTLNYLGFENVSILSGGKAAWKASGLELSSEIPQIVPTKLNLKPRESLVISKDEVAKAIDKETTIIDCRAESFYTGVSVNEHHGGRKGHIPGAKSIPYMSLFEKSEKGFYQFLDKETLKNIFKNQDLNVDDDIILYCHIGLQLTAVYTASQLLGYKNVRVFDGSFHEWGPDKSLPVTTD